MRSPRPRSVMRRQPAAGLAQPPLGQRVVAARGGHQALHAGQAGDQRVGEVGRADRLERGGAHLGLGLVAAAAARASASARARRASGRLIGASPSRARGEELGGALVLAARRARRRPLVAGRQAQRTRGCPAGRPAPRRRPPRSARPPRGGRCAGTDGRAPTRSAARGAKVPTPSRASRARSMNSSARSCSPAAMAAAAALIQMPADRSGRPARTASTPAAIERAVGLARTGRGG